LAYRAFYPQQRSGLERSKQPVRETASRDSSDMQLEELTVMRRARDREAATAAAFEEDVQILSRLETQGLNHGQAQQDLHDVASEGREACNPAGERFDLHVSDGCDEARFDHEVGEGACLTEQNVAGLLFGGGETEGTTVGVADLTRSESCAARAAMARLATVGKVQAGAESCLQYGLIGMDSYRSAVGLDSH